MLIVRRAFSRTRPQLAKPSPSVAGVANDKTLKKRLGRPSNNLSTGLVGLANVGKSTFFQALTKSTLGNPANYPFATIEPEKALIKAPLSRQLSHYMKIFRSNRSIPTNHTIWDIAGLTRNAHSGSGLGNKFLSDIRQVDGILQVVRGFVDDDITHVEESGVDPVRDMILVNDELILKDLEIIESHLEKMRKMKKKPNGGGGGGGASATGRGEEEMSVLEKLSDVLYDGKKIISYSNGNGEWSDDEIDIINGLNLLTAKPTVYLLNVSEDDYCSGTNQYYQQVSNWILENCPGDKLIMFSAQHERRLNELQDEELEKYKTIYPRGSVISQVVEEIKTVLNLISFYTCGPLEARQWSLRRGSLAPEAAGLIHSDLQKTFINAIVYKWDDLVDVDEFDEGKLKTSGKQHKQGKKYLVEDGDVLVIKAASGKARAELDSDDSIDSADSADNADSVDSVDSVASLDSVDSLTSQCCSTISLRSIGNLTVTTPPSRFARWCG
ncbi:hypothetical protein KGF56_002050 [Candida oxycetoniae]|uniref:Obg-like ATPase homolog n=1 Tax=Candida oxycetoniae TaxID=497107 RepID=A0AAI9SXU2_9ASCO|nr:uncharacterized protein KGF56_002050 [Candida oxycetoniae]KAI3405094.2 hypothetical protein KGF56_002050 [Candida oxycetoniae]